MSGIRFGSSACNRAFSSWEASRIDPPDECDEESTPTFTESVCVRTDRGVRYWRSYTSKDQTEEVTVHYLKALAQSAWVDCTERGSLLRQALLESVSPTPPSRVFSSGRFRASSVQYDIVLCSEDCSKDWPTNGYTLLHSSLGVSWLQSSWAFKTLTEYPVNGVLGRAWVPCKWICATNGHEQKTGWVVSRFRYGSVRVTTSVSPMSDE